MHLYLIVAKPREGKSRYAKAMIGQGKGAQQPCYVFDAMNEYGPTYKTIINGKDVMVKGLNLPENQPELLRSRYTGVDMDINIFLENVKKKRDSNIVIEECTGFLKGNTSPLLRKLIAGRYHSGNNFVFVFHSLRTIPPDILLMANYVILFNTLDDVDFVRKKINIEDLTAGLKRRRDMRTPDQSRPTIINFNK